MCDASLALLSPLPPPLCGKSHQQQGPLVWCDSILVAIFLSCSFSSPPYPPCVSSLLLRLTHKEKQKNRENEGKMERRRKAMWLYPKVVGFNPPERWGHSACFFEGVIYVFGVCLPSSVVDSVPSSFASIASSLSVRFVFLIMVSLLLS